MFQLENGIFKVIKNSIERDEIISAITRSLEKNPIKLYLYNQGKINYSFILDILNKIPEKRGLYYFEARRISTRATWNDLNATWDKLGVQTQEGKFKKESSPSFVKERWNKHKKYFDKIDDRAHFFPFYIGKTNNLKERIINHVITQNKKGGYKGDGDGSLRIQQRYEHQNTTNVMKCFLFRVSYLQIDIEEELLPIIESRIRHKKSCMVGRDRK